MVAEWANRSHRRWGQPQEWPTSGKVLATIGGIVGALALGGWAGHGIHTEAVVGAAAGIPRIAVAAARVAALVEHEGSCWEFEQSEKRRMTEINIRDVRRLARPLKVKRLAYIRTLSGPLLFLIVFLDIPIAALVDQRWRRHGNTLSHRLETVLISSIFDHSNLDICEYKLDRKGSASDGPKVSYG